VVISSRQPPPFAVDLRLELAPLPPEALAAYPHAWERTGGLPALVEAFLRGEALHSVLEARLSSLSAEARELYLCLALLDHPDLPLVRRALELAADVMAQAAEDLLSAGLMLPDGQAEARQIALDYLEAHPTIRGRLSLRLAQRLSEGRLSEGLAQGMAQGSTQGLGEPGSSGAGELAAFPLYQYSRLIWTPADEAGALQAYLSWGRELLRRGFPARAAEILATAPPSPAARMLRGRALERAGHYQESLDTVADLTQTPDLLALLSTLYWRLGRADAARCAAEQALECEQLEVRAEALNTQGNLALGTGEPKLARTLFSRAATLWQAAGDRARWSEALNNMAVAECHSEQSEGIDVERAFKQALDAAGDHPRLRAIVLSNLGSVYRERGELKHAQRAFQLSTTIADEGGLLTEAALAWQNLGVIFHLQEQCSDADHAYRQGIDRAQRAGDRRTLAMSLANLAELNEDQDAWTEALTLLKTAGHAALANVFHDNLDTHHPFRQRSGVLH
jgi:tetratricopeptide (TPR) repeat protein